MDTLFGTESLILQLIHLVLAIAAIAAFVNSLLYSAESYVAANKLTKPTWCIILGLAALLEIYPIGGFLLSIAAIVATLVYLLDVRPALAGLYRR